MPPASVGPIPATGVEARQQCRHNVWDSPTSGIASGYLQANLIVLPSKFANDFKILSARMPVPCPLLASSAKLGDFANFTSHVAGIPDARLASALDIRHDIARYNVYVDGKLAHRNIPHVRDPWDLADHVACLIGCSFSFENALTAAGLPPPHTLQGRNVPMYPTNIPLCPAGAFVGSTCVVSMRFYRKSEVQAVRELTRPYITTHGEPIGWGWDFSDLLGVKDIGTPDWGDPPVRVDGSMALRSEEEANVDGVVPVFWGCGVTPQEAVMKANIPGVVIGHAPGHMLVLDVREEDVISNR